MSGKSHRSAPENYRNAVEDLDQENDCGQVAKGRCRPGWRPPPRDARDDITTGEIRGRIEICERSGAPELVGSCRHRMVVGKKKLVINILLLFGPGREQGDPKGARSRDVRRVGGDVMAEDHAPVPAVKGHGQHMLPGDKRREHRQARAGARKQRQATEKRHPADGPSEASLAAVNHGSCPLNSPGERYHDSGRPASFSSLLGQAMTQTARLPFPWPREYLGRPSSSREPRGASPRPQPPSPIAREVAWTIFRRPTMESRDDHQHATGIRTAPATMTTVTPGAGTLKVSSIRPYLERARALGAEVVVRRPHGDLALGAGR